MTIPVRSEGKLVGKTAIVTGGSSGIGAAIARAFVAEGAAVKIVHCRDGENADKALAALKSVDARCRAEDCDVADETKVMACVDDAVRAFGHIDILVNCAGIGLGGPVEEMTLEVWNRVLAVNLTGAFLMSRACYPPMKARGSGRIINIASQLAFCGFAGASAYCASKAGMIGLTRSLALEAAPFGVLVNAIAPGATLTNMVMPLSEDQKQKSMNRIPLGRIAMPDEIAPTAVLLASDDGSFYVGQTLSPNGGDVMR
jgi:3-oxoacyl-[acyl-carrier protein] reductase